MNIKVLLSGGWGYGNLGDDAILLASIELIKKKLPHAEITIMSYSPQDTATLIPSLKVIPSIHRIIYGNRAYKQLRTYKHTTNIEAFPLLWRIISKIKRIIGHDSNYKSYSILEKKIRGNKLEALKEIFRQHDIFIMSGGGYFNEWEDSFNSRIIELELSKQCSSSFIVGQTLGPFSKAKQDILKQHLNEIKRVYVRDIASLNELNELGYNTILIPDLALSYIPQQYRLIDKITIIPAEIPRYKRDEFTQAIYSICKTMKLPVQIAITRLYNGDINCAKDLFNRMKNIGIKNVTLHIPTNYIEIVQTISHSKYVISRNLHGLIIGWREGAKCICLHKERKLISFMAQISASDCIVDIEGDIAMQLLKCFNKLNTLNTCKQYEIHKSLVMQITNNISFT